jgi:hypothetical protein
MSAPSSESSSTFPPETEFAASLSGPTARASMSRPRTSPLTMSELNTCRWAAEATPPARARKSATVAVTLA